MLRAKLYFPILLMFLLLLFLAACSSAPAGEPKQILTLAPPSATVTGQVTATPSLPTATPSPTMTVEAIDLKAFHQQWVRMLMQAAFLKDDSAALGMLPGENGAEILERAKADLLAKGMPGNDGVTLSGDLFSDVSKSEGDQVYSGIATWNYTAEKMCSISTIAFVEGEWSVTGWSWSPCRPDQDATPQAGG